MKKIVIVVVVMFLVLVAAPWGIGRLAEKRVNAGLDKIVEQAPYLTIVERKWTGGWFRSEQEVTFEVFGAWLDAMNPAKVLAEAEAQAAQEAGVENADEESSAAEELERRRQSAVPGAETPVESEAAPEPAPARPMRFTVRNEILHGPVLWTSGLGLARVNTRLVLGEETRKKLVETLGTDEPVRIRSRVSFFGGGSTRFFGDGRTIEFKENGGVLAYDDFKLDFDYSGDFDEAEMDGSWSKFEYTDNKTGERMLMKGMSLDGEVERIVGDLYDSDFDFDIDEMVFTGADQMETVVQDVHYVVDTEHEDGFVDVAVKFGSGKVSNPAFAEMQLELKEVHYDFTARHLHAETLQKLMEAIKASYAKPVASLAEVNEVVFAPVKEHGLALLKHEPVFSIDRIGVVTADGDGVIKGEVRLQGVTEADFAAVPMGLLDKLVADITIEVAQKLLEKIPNGATGAGMAVDQGFATRESEKLVSRIEYRKGELKVNGKPLPIPGLGAPPPAQDGYPGEEPPPQE